MRESDQAFKLFVGRMMNTTIHVQSLDGPESTASSLKCMRPASLAYILQRIAEASAWPI